MLGFRDSIERLLNLQRALAAPHAADWFGVNTASRGAFPPCNVFRQGQDLVLIAELPGVSKDELNIEVKRNQIRLSGDKTVGYKDGASLHRRERISGHFDRTITLPTEIDADKIKAQYSDGILALFVPRAEADKPRTISVN